MIDYKKVTLEQLNQENGERVLWGQAYLDYQLLYEGGLSFKRAAGRNSLTIAAIQGAPATSLDLMANLGRRRRFLRQLEGEPDTKYISRWEACYYIPYVAAIIDYFRHWLFSNQPNIRPCPQLEDGQELADLEETPDPPEWYDAFMRDATGAGQSFFDLGKHVFGDVLIYRRAGWLISTADMCLDTDGAAPISLTSYDARNILDWQEDGSGKLEWILLKNVTTRRNFPDYRRMIEVRTFVDKNSWGSWEITREPNSDEDIPILLGWGEHNLGEVPFEWITVPEGMWVMNKLAAWQVDLFNQMSILTYGQLMSCFLQPYITSAEATESSASRIMGEGIVLNLRCGDANGRGEEKFGWVSPDVSPLEFNAKRIIEQRDEGYRIVHQMALAVDSQAIGAIARSGVSKIEDRKAAEIMLKGYGGYVKDFQLRTLEKIGRLMGDNTKFMVEGYDNFEVSSLEEELQTAALAQTFQIHSTTFNAELEKSIAAGRVMNHLDEMTKAKMRREIEDHYIAKSEEDMMGQDQLDPMTGEPMVPMAEAPVGMPPKPPKAPGPTVTG